MRFVNRQQMSWRAVDVERLVDEGHPARSIGMLVGRLDLQRFYQDIESSAEEGGRPGSMRSARGSHRREKWRGLASTIRHSRG
jgi:hypothetical protein